MRIKPFVKYSVKYGYKKYFQVAVIVFCIAVSTFLIHYSLMMLEGIGSALDEKAKSVIAGTEIAVHKKASDGSIVIFESDYEELLGGAQAIGTIETPVQFVGGERIGYAKLVAVQTEAVIDGIRLIETVGYPAQMKAEQVIVAERFAAAHGYKAGDKIACYAGEVPYYANICGIAKNTGVFYTNDIVAPYEGVVGALCRSFSLLYDEDDKPYTNIYIIGAGMPEGLSDALSQSETMQGCTVIVTKNKHSFSLMEIIINLIIVFVALMMGILFAVVCYPTYESMLASRQNDIAILHDSGAKSGRLALLFAAESTVYSLIGGAIGVLWAQGIFLLSYGGGYIFDVPTIFSTNALISMLYAVALCNVCTLIFTYIYNKKHLNKGKYGDNNTLYTALLFGAVGFVSILLVFFSNAALYFVLLCLCVFAFLQGSSLMYSSALALISRCKPKNGYLRLLSNSRHRVSRQLSFNKLMLFFIVFAAIIGYFITCADVVISGYGDLSDGELIAVSVNGDTDCDLIRQVEGVDNVALAAIHTLEMPYSEPIRIWGADTGGNIILKNFVSREDWRQFCEAPDNVAMMSETVYFNIERNEYGKVIIKIDGIEREYTPWVNENLLLNDVMVKLTDGIKPNAIFIDTDGSDLTKIKSGIRLANPNWIVFEEKELMYSSASVALTLFENIKNTIIPIILLFFTIGLGGSAMLSVVKRKSEFDLLDTLGYSKYRLMGLVNTEIGVYLAANLPLCAGAVVVVKYILDELLNTVYKSNFFTKSLFPNSLYIMAACCAVSFAIASLAVLFRKKELSH